MDGDRDRTFSRVYDEHVWTIYGFVGYRVRDRQEAEDLTQQTFERALRAWPRYDPARASESTWLIAIARNLVIDHFRRRRDVPVEDPGGASRDPADPSGDPAANLGVSPELEAALGRLSARDREIIALRFGGDLKGQEIADLLDLSLANVQQILSRALRHLRKELEDAAAEGR